MPKATASHFTSLFQTDITNASDAELFIRTNADGTGGVGISGDYTGAFQYDAWQRLAFTFVDNNDGTLTLSKYINGVLVGTQGVPADRFGLDISKGALMFSDEDGENSPLYVSSLLVTDKVYSGAEIAALGGATAGGIAPTAPTIYSTQFDFSTDDLAPTYGPADLGLTQGGETGAFLLKGTVFSRPDAEAGMPAPEAALWEMSDAAGNKLVWSGEGSEHWSDYVFEAGITSMDNGHDRPDFLLSGRPELLPLLHGRRDQPSPARQGQGRRRDRPGREPHGLSVQRRAEGQGRDRRQRHQRLPRRQERVRRTGGRTPPRRSTTARSASTPAGNARASSTT